MDAPLNAYNHSLVTTAFPLVSFFSSAITRLFLLPFRFSSLNKDELIIMIIKSISSPVYLLNLILLMQNVWICNVHLLLVILV